MRPILMFPVPVFPLVASSVRLIPCGHAMAFPVSPKEGSGEIRRRPVVLRPRDWKGDI
jgi:hypothetical protein